MRKVLLATILVLSLAGGAIQAEGFGDPNFFYEPASIGFLLPKDTAVSEEDGVFYYTSKKAKMTVIAGELEKAYKNAEVLDTKKFTAVLKEFGATNIKLSSSVPEGELVWNSATVTMKWDDGSVDQGFYVLVNSKAAKGSSFLIGFFVPKLDPNDYDNPAVVAMETFSYGTPCGGSGGDGRHIEPIIRDKGKRRAGDRGRGCRPLRDAVAAPLP